MIGSIESGSTSAGINSIGGSSAALAASLVAT